MTTADKLNAKFEAKLKQKNWQLDNAAGVKRLADAVIVGEKEQSNGCALFAAGASVLTLAAGIVAVMS